MVIIDLRLREDIRYYGPTLLFLAISQVLTNMALYRQSSTHTDDLVILSTMQEGLQISLDKPGAFYS